MILTWCRGPRASRATSIILFSVCWHDVHIILRSYHSCSSVVRDDETKRALAETQQIWAKLRIGKNKRSRDNFSGSSTLPSSSQFRSLVTMVMMTTMMILRVAVFVKFHVVCRISNYLWTFNLVLHIFYHVRDLVYNAPNQKTPNIIITIIIKPRNKHIKQTRCIMLQRISSQQRRTRRWFCYPYVVVWHEHTLGRNRTAVEILVITFVPNRTTSVTKVVH